MRTKYSVGETKRAVVVGLLTAMAGGLLYLLSLGFVGTPWLSAAILLCSPALLGGAESLVITGAVSWGLALAGPANTGRVIAWVGMAMFAARALPMCPEECFDSRNSCDH